MPIAVPMGPAWPRPAGRDQSCRPLLSRSCSPCRTCRPQAAVLGGLARRAAALAAGVAAAFALLIRPNLLPMAALAGAWLVVQVLPRCRPRPSRLAPHAFAAPLVLRHRHRGGPITRCLIRVQIRLRTSQLFARPTRPNAWRYARWFLKPRRRLRRWSLMLSTAAQTWCPMPAGSWRSSPPRSRRWRSAYAARGVQSLVGLRFLCPSGRS